MDQFIAWYCSDWLANLNTSWIVRVYFINIFIASKSLISKDYY